MTSLRLLVLAFDSVVTTMLLMDLSMDRRVGGRSKLHSLSLFLTLLLYRRARLFMYRGISSGVGFLLRFFRVYMSSVTAARRRTGGSLC